VQFAEILAAQTPESGRIPEGWKQGRATYGGLTAAMLYKSLEQILPDPRPVVWVSISLIGPSDPGEVTLAPRILRQGKNVIQGECHMHQNGQAVAALQASFGSRRDSGVRLAPSPAPVFPEPEQSHAFPQIEGVTPEFLQHFDVVLARGDFPYAGAEHGQLGGWMRFRDAMGPLDPTAMLGMLDCWPPTVLPMMRQPAPVSTLTWTVQFLEGHSEQRGDDWWQYQADTEASDHGYAQTSARVWDRAGRLMALSQQTIAVFG
jgi:acyl-CoA thioesterase